MYSLSSLVPRPPLSYTVGDQEHLYKKIKTLKMQKDVGMACQKVCKQGRDDA